MYANYISVKWGGGVRQKYQLLWYCYTLSWQCILLYKLHYCTEQAEQTTLVKTTLNVGKGETPELAKRGGE